MADLTSVAPLLKEVWVPTMNTAFNEEIIGLARIERAGGIRNDVTGRYTVVPVRTRRHQGIGARPERGILPLPGKRGYVGARVEVGSHYAVGDVTAQMIALADGDPRSFANMFDEDFSGLRDDARKDMARQVYGRGGLGMSTVTAVVGAPDLVVDAIQYLEEDMVVDFVTPGTSTVTKAGATIEAVDESTKTITVDDATGVVNGDVVVRAGSFGQEINGLDILIDDTLAVQNIDPANERRWAAVVDDNGGAGRAWSEIGQKALIDKIRRRGGKIPSAMFTGFGVERAVFADLSQTRDFTNTITFAHGFSALPFHYGAQTIPLVSDPDFPEEEDAATGKILCVSEGDVSFFQEERGWHVADETGSIFIAKADRSDAWEYRMRLFSQLGIHQRNSHGVYDDINTVSA